MEAAEAKIQRVLERTKQFDHARKRTRAPEWVASSWRASSAPSMGSRRTEANSLDVFTDSSRLVPLPRDAPEARRQVKVATPEDG